VYYVKSDKNREKNLFCTPLLPEYKEKHIPEAIPHIPKTIPHVREETLHVREEIRRMLKMFQRVTNAKIRLLLHSQE
jgi:hypothetical protein